MLSTRESLLVCEKFQPAAAAKRALLLQGLGSALRRHRKFELTPQVLFLSSQSSLGYTRSQEPGRTEYGRLLGTGDSKKGLQST